MDQWIYKLLILVLFAVGMSWGGSKKDRDWVLVKYNNFAKLFMIFILLSCISITYDAFTDEKEIKDFVLMILCGITISSLFGVNEVYRSKAWFDENKIYIQSPYGRKIEMDYKEIISCKISVLSNYVITNQRGKKARLPMYMAGVEEMVKFIKFKISQN